MNSGSRFSSSIKINTITKDLNYFYNEKNCVDNNISYYCATETLWLFSHDSDMKCKFDWNNL